MWDIIWGTGANKKTTNVKNPCEEERIFHDLFTRFNEIYHSYNNLLDCAVYVRQYPNYKSYVKRGITKTKYLRYHIREIF